MDISKASITSMFNDTQLQMEDLKSNQILYDKKNNLKNYIKFKNENRMAHYQQIF